MAHGRPRTPLLHRRSEARPGARRSVVACNRCRNRKTRCAGNPPLPCPSCEDAGQLCVYSEADKRVSIPESYLRLLQSQAQAQTQIHTPRPESTFSAVSPSSNQPTPNANVEHDDWWFNGTDNLFLNRSGEHHFVGPSSATHMAKRLNPSSTNLAWDVRPLYDDPLSLRRSTNRALPQLPPYDFAKRLFWVQYAYIGTIFSLIQPKEFEERLDIVYNQPTDFSNRESCLMYCQVLLVIAFGLMYSVNQWSGDDGPPGFKYFKHALRFLPDIHEEGSIFFVDVLCYVAYYMQNLNRRDAAFLYIGLALRMAISLGLHQEVSDPDISEIERDRRRRAWWSVYSLDRILSVKSGNPITIQDEDIGTIFPGPVACPTRTSQNPNPSTDQVQDGSTGIPWPSLVLTHYTQLSRILGRIGEEIYRKKPRSGSNLLASVQSITNALSDWLRRVPNQLRIDFTNLDSHINRDCVSISLHFYSCVNMTVRPLVFYVIQRQLDAEAQGSATEDWKAGLSQNAVAVIDSCITAARATTLIMDAAAKQNLTATYGYLDGEYAFSAALLLVMVNAAFPHNDTNARTMEMALGLLRGMADRGNTYLGSRHSLLLELQSIIGPGARKRGDLLSEGPVTPGSSLPQSLPATMVTTDNAAARIPTDWPLERDLPSIEDISFNFDLNEDTGLWEEVLGQIDIDMDTDWIEHTLRR